MEYFISIAGERSGPHSQFQIIEKIRDGALNGEELAWRKGVEEWKPLRDFDEFTGYWKPTPQQVAVAEHVRQVARIALDTPQPWLRFWARTMDYVWFTMLLSLTINAVAPKAATWLLEARDKPTQGHTMILIVLPVAIFMLFVPLEAFWLSRRGTTPGKALLRIQVRRIDGSLPDYSQALLRSALVFVKGLALFLFFPIPQLFLMSWCRIRLIQLGTTSWDEQTGLRVEHGEPETWRYLLVVIIAAFIALVFASGIVVGLQGAGIMAPTPE